ncbi:hypothetical protein BVRB_2g043740 isoform C [Beta vulgaris subsp. vulgaris]|nr:hypothetical protein BVRB_2g043740 isoform C [Beta vulgaris subsp. vulgaris]
MMGRSKEEDKIEKIIRGLLKLSENRRCINCNSLGPQYVCTNFWTFVCTNCSGVHREFTHRVKSVSMAKFSMEEVSALQAGGNEKARQTYFKTWDPQRNFSPENSNIDKIRDLIKHVYVDKQYTGETRPALGSRLRNSDIYEPDERRRGDVGESSTFHDKTMDRDRYSRYSCDEVRSPQNLRENSRYGNLRTSSSRVEGTGGSYQVDDMREHFRYGSGRAKSSSFDGRDGRFQVDDSRENSRFGGPMEGSSRFEGKFDGRYQVDDTRISGRATTQMFTTEDIKPRRSSPDRQQSSDMNRPTVQHVKEILGENYLALRAANQPKFADRRCVRAIAYPQQGRNNYRENHRGGYGVGHCQKNHRQEIGKNSRKNHRRTVSAQNSVESGSQVPSYSNAGLKTKSGSVGSLLAIADVPSPDRVVQKAGPQTRVSLKQPVKANACDAPKNTLEFLLFELPSPAASDQSGIPCHDNGVSSASTGNPSTWHHEPAALASESPSLEIVPISSSFSGDSSHVAAAQASKAKCSSSAANVATTSKTVQTSTPARSTDANAPIVATYQTMPDLLGDDGVPVTDAKSPCSQHLDRSHVFVSDINSSIPTHHSNKGSNDHPTTLSSAPSVPVVSDNCAAQSSQFALGPTGETESSEEIQSSPTDAKAAGRTELPAELFASPYQLNSMSSSVWQPGPNYGMGFHMHYYPPQVQIPLIPNVAKSTNPFDTNDNIAQPDVNMFASKGTLQSGLPNVFSPAGMSHITSSGPHFPGFAPTVSPACPAGAYMSQQLFQNMSPNSIQGTSGFGGGVGSTLPLHSNQHIPYRYPAPTDQSSFPKGGGNPFE